MAIPKKMQVSIDDSLAPLAERIENLLPALQEIGAYFDGQFRVAFDVQGRGEPWSPRNVPNVAGIIKDLEQGGSIKPRRFDASATLQDTGYLKESGGTRIDRTDNTVWWGTPLAYAAPHQFGEESTIYSRVPQMARSGNKKVLKEIQRLEEAGFEDTARALLNQDSFTYDLPQRQMLEIIPQDKKVVKAVLSRHAKGEPPRKDLKNGP